MHKFDDRNVKCRLTQAFTWDNIKNQYASGYKMLVYYPILGGNNVIREKSICIDLPLRNFIEEDLPGMIDEISDEVKAFHKYLESINDTISDDGIASKKCATSYPKSLNVNEKGEEYY